MGPNFRGAAKQRYVPVAAFGTMIVRSPEKLQKLADFPLDPTPGATSIRTAVSQLRGDS
jgi:hypothetical protein